MAGAAAGGGVDTDGGVWADVSGGFGALRVPLRQGVLSGVHGQLHQNGLDSHDKQAHIPSQTTN